MSRLQSDAACPDTARRDRFAVDATFFLLCFLPLAGSLLLTTDGAVSTLHLFGASVPLRTVCVFRLFTGYRCPVCGMTRCFAYMAHGNLPAAWRMSHAGVPLFVFCIFESAYRLLLLALSFAARPLPAPAGVFLRVCRAAEAAGLAAVCAGVAFFFAAQFFAPALVL